MEFFKLGWNGIRGKYFKRILVIPCVVALLISATLINGRLQKITDEDVRASLSSQQNFYLKDASSESEKELLLDQKNKLIRDHESDIHGVIFLILVAGILSILLIFFLPFVCPICKHPITPISTNYACYNCKKTMDIFKGLIILFCPNCFTINQYVRCPNCDHEIDLFEDTL